MGGTVDDYLATDDGPAGRLWCPGLLWHDTDGGLRPCPSCHDTDYVAASYARAYFKAMRLPEIIEELEAGRTATDVAARLLEEAERNGIHNDRDVMTVHAGLVFGDGTIFQNDGRGLLMSREEIEQLRQGLRLAAWACPVCHAARSHWHAEGCAVWPTARRLNTAGKRDEAMRFLKWQPSLEDMTSTCESCCLPLSLPVHDMCGGEGG